MKNKYDYLTKLKDDLLQKLESSNLEFQKEVQKIKNEEQKEFLLKLHKEAFEEGANPSELIKKLSDYLNNAD